MNKFILWSLIWALALTWIIFNVSAQERLPWANNNTDSLSEINKIQNPYEQCLAYVKMKKLENFDCKLQAESMKPVQWTGTMIQTWSKMQPPQSGGTGAVGGSGMKLDKFPKRVPLVWTGAVREAEMKSLGMAIGKLTPTQRMELMKMIRNYLESKGVKNQNPEDKKESSTNKDEDSNKKIPLTREEILANQQALQEKVRAMKEKQKEYTGHITLNK